MDLPLMNVCVYGRFFCWRKRVQIWAADVGIVVAATVVIVVGGVAGISLREFL